MRYHSVTGNHCAVPAGLGNRGNPRCWQTLKAASVWIRLQTRASCRPVASAGSETREPDTFEELDLDTLRIPTRRSHRRGADQAHRSAIRVGRAEGAVGLRLKPFDLHASEPSDSPAEKTGGRGTRISALTRSPVRDRPGIRPEDRGPPGNSADGSSLVRTLNENKDVVAEGVGFRRYRVFVPCESRCDRYLFSIGVLSGRPSFESVRALAQRRQVSERTVRRLIASGALRAHTVGRQLRVSRKDREDYERRCRK